MPAPAADATSHVFDAHLAAFEQEVILRSKQVPVLVDFWAAWCGPCKSLGPILEKLAAEFNGGFVLAKVDVDAEQQLAGYFQIKSIPTVMLLKDGQIVDGFPGALPEAQLREFLSHHGIEPRVADAQPEPEAAPVPPSDPHAEVVRLRAAVHAAPDQDEIKLDLALAAPRSSRPHRRASRWRRRSPPTRPTCGRAYCWACACWWRATTPPRSSNSWKSCAATAAGRTSGPSAA